MERENLIGYAVLFVGFVAMAIVLFGLSALAADQPTATPIAPLMESGKDLSDRDLSTPRIDPKTGELAKEMEQPMRMPDTGNESNPFNSQPRSAPSANEVNYAYCTEGNDCVSF